MRRSLPIATGFSTDDGGRREVVGVWKREIKRSGIEITLCPFSPLGDRAEEFREAAKHYSDFMEMPIGRVES